MQRPIELAPSILSADLLHLQETLTDFETAKADLIHIDVMDGHFVPNLSFGANMVRACKRGTRLPLDVHLMVANPEPYLSEYIQSGASFLTIHIEAVPHIHRAIHAIKDQGCRAGVALNPGTPLEYLEPILCDVDLVLIMSVNPGFGGQRFIEGSLKRIATVRSWLDRENPNCKLEVDGGIDTQTAGRARRAGADILVAGSSVFGTPDVVQNIQQLRHSL